MHIYPHILHFAGSPGVGRKVPSDKRRRRRVSSVASWSKKGFGIGIDFGIGVALVFAVLFTLLLVRLQCGR